MVSKDTAAAQQPPAQLFVVLPRRVRAGKGPMAISPAGWVVAHGGVRVGVYAQVGNKRVDYLLVHCHESLEAALRGVAAVANRVERAERRRLDELVAKLRQAKGSAAAQQT